MNTSDAPIAGPASESGPDRRWLALALLCAAWLLVGLDFTIVYVALPSIGEALGFSQQGLQWVVNAYALTFGGFLLLGGRAADLLGRRRVLIAALVLFALASLVGGLAGSQALLIGARALQGLGGAMLAPAALSIVTTTFKEGTERNRALSFWGGTGAGGLALGIILGGLLTNYLGWQWIFLINVPLALGVAALVPALIRESRDRTAAGGYDAPGAVLVTIGVTLLVYALVRAPEVGWLSAQTLLSAGLALVLLAAFVAVEARSRAPLMPLRLFRLRTLTGANAIAALFQASTGGQFFITTLYMQEVLGYSPLSAGLAFLPLGVVIVLSSYGGGTLATRLGVKPTLALGMGLVAVSLLILTRVSPDGTYPGDLLLGMLVVAVGQGLAFTGFVIAGTAGVEDREQGVASGLLTTSQQVGGALGLAVLVAVSASATAAMGGGAGSLDAQADALTGGFVYAYWAAAALAVLGTLIALFVVGREDCEAAKKGIEGPTPAYCNWPMVGDRTRAAAGPPRPAPNPGKTSVPGANGHGGSGSGEARPRPESPGRAS